jgi:hypothetical protein
VARWRGLALAEEGGLGRALGGGWGGRRRKGRVIHSGFWKRTDKVFHTNVMIDYILFRFLCAVVLTRKK